MNIKILVIIVTLWLPCGVAAPRIAVLDFELNDITSMPNTAQEKQRTASIRPLLEQALVGAGDYQIVTIPAEQYTAANAGLGYLYRFHELAAQLGEHYDADWIVVGQHSKPSFLFSYLMGQLIRVKTETIVARFAIELKGTHPTVLQHGVKTLAEEITVAISGNQ